MTSTRYTLFVVFLSAANMPVGQDSLSDSLVHKTLIRLDRYIQRDSQPIKFYYDNYRHLADPVVYQLSKPVDTFRSRQESLEAVPLAGSLTRGEPAMPRTKVAPTESLNTVQIGGLVQSISLDRHTYHQGEIAYMNVNTTLPIGNVSVRFLQRTYKLYALSSTLYQTLLAVPMDADSGRHKMTLSYEEGGAKKTVKLPFMILPGEFAEVDTAEMDIGVLTEETLEMLKYEGRYFTRAYGKDTDSVLYDGDFIWPCEGSITAVFGVARRYNKDLDKWSHKAIDIANAVGTDILASNSGLVVLAEDLDGHGKSIVISHGQGIHTVYLHLNKILVEKGDRVLKGQIIGEMGNTGICTGSNLHWQIMLNRVPTDPRVWMQDGVRKVKSSYVKPQLPEQTQN
jgi:murein DD-endopeptidase MepM/ murein hydrolase activator NlpD